MRGRHSTRDIFIRDVKAVRGPGADFLRGVAFLEHQIFRFAKMISLDGCSTSYDPASLFVAGAVL